MYSIDPVPTLPLPTDRIDPAYAELPSLGREVASDVSSEVSLVRDSTERAGSGDPVMNPTMVWLKPAWCNDPAHHKTESLCLSSSPWIDSLAHTVTGVISK